MHIDSRGNIHMTGAEAMAMGQASNFSYGVQPNGHTPPPYPAYNDEYSRGETAATVTALGIGGLIVLYFLNKSMNK